MTAKTKGVVTAGHPDTAAAGVEMLRLGGNAFDAAIAAVFASFVTESVLTSPAGGGFLLAHTQANQNILFDFFSQTPSRPLPADQLDFYPIQANFGDATQEFHIGLGAMAVPSNLLGLCHVHQKLGRLPLNDIVAPAIHLAQTGVQLDDFHAYCFRILQPILLATAGARALYAPHGTLLQSGDRFYMTDLADSLTLLLKEGVDAFYRGAIAHQLVKDCQAQGGHLTLEDLQQYQVIERPPLRVTYRGKTLLTNPPPSSGGALIAFALELLSCTGVADLSWGSTDHLRLLTEVMRLTNAARRDGYDAHLYRSTVAAEFLGEAHVDPYRQRLMAQIEEGDSLGTGPGECLPLKDVNSLESDSSSLNSPGLNKFGSTTHVSVVDSEGNAASVTTSNGEGSAYVIPGTGMMVNNMLGEADLNPHGFHQWQPNQRISSMMAPTMVLRGAASQLKPELVLGSGGSNRIRTAILQVISNLIDFQQTLPDAVAAPRIHWENQVFNIEPGFTEGAIAQLQPELVAAQDQIIPWSQQSLFFGGVNAVSVSPEGHLVGAGDPRRRGSAQSTASGTT